MTSIFEENGQISRFGWVVWLPLPFIVGQLHEQSKNMSHTYDHFDEGNLEQFLRTVENWNFEAIGWTHYE